MITIAVDAHGGDYAPQEVVAGALQAAEHWQDLKIVFTGDTSQLQPLVAQTSAGDRIEMVHAPECIGMDEAPVDAVRHKRNSSLVAAAQLIKQGRAQGLVSAGNTGAAMAASVFYVGRIAGVERPAITSLMPTLQGVSLLADVGANVDTRASHLVQFAYMGQVYARRVLGVTSPRVGLLNIGEEPTKGTEAVQAAYQELQRRMPEFVGNIEGRDLPAGAADVVIADGFVGNIVLKFAEGLGSALFGMLRDEMTATLSRKLAASVLRPAFSSIKKRMDYTEYGGAPLLGTDGVCIIAHGRSNAKAIFNAVRVAREAVDSAVVSTIAEVMAGDVCE